MSAMPAREVLEWFRSQVEVGSITLQGGRVLHRTQWMFRGCPIWIEADSEAQASETSAQFCDFLNIQVPDEVRGAH